VTIWKNVIKIGKYVMSIETLLNEKMNMDN